MSIGRVTGSPYFDSEPVVLSTPNGTDDPMRHKLRRQVAWGPLIKRDNVPVAMEMTLFAHQTVFNIDKFWTSVYHLMYPCFSHKNRLYISANIQQQNDLDNFAISQFFGLLSGVEIMSKLAELESNEWEHYPANLPRLREQLDLNLSSKAEFMSPGTIWATLLLDSSQLVTAALIYVMLFGGDMKFFKADGLIDTHTRQKMWALVLKLIETHDFKRVRKNLKVDIPRLDTSALEVPEQKTQRIKRKSSVIVEQSSGRTPPSDP